jgi:hypothetical protein
MIRNLYGEVQEYGLDQLTRGVRYDYGVRYSYGETDLLVSALTSTLTASPTSFATDSSSTLTFTARNSNNVTVEGFTPTVEPGVV